MLLRTVEVLLLLSFPAFIYADDPPYSRFGAGEAGVAYACVASEGHWSSFHNQALLPYNRVFSIGSSFESRFMMKEMSAKTFSCIIPGKTAPLSLIASHYGNSQYSLISGGIGSGIVISKGISMGIQIDLFREHCAGYYKDLSFVTFEAGMSGQISPEVMVGFHIFNPLNQTNPLPASIRTGLTWKNDESLFIAVEAVKTSRIPMAFRCGLSWALKKQFILRTGYSSGPSSFTFGAGYSFSNFSLDTGFIVNSNTGITPSFSVLWKANKK